MAALPLGLIFFVISFVSVLVQYKPKVIRKTGDTIIRKQLDALGQYHADEKITILIVALSLLGFITQSWHHINGAWIALTSFFLLFATGVLGD